MHIEVLELMITQIIAQVIGLLALCVTIVCYQFNSPKKILIAQLIASVLFTVNLALLGGMSGALLNIHGICRALTFSQRGRYRWADATLFWVIFYCIAAVVCVAFTYQSPVDLLPLAGQICTTIALSMTNARMIRICTLPSPPCWLTYHLFSGNIGGILNEVFVIVSIVVGMFRLDRKPTTDASASENDAN